MIKVTESDTMTNSEIDPLFSDEEIMKSWQMFQDCGDNHKWVDEPDDSVFYKRCTVCGGAQGIRFD